MNWKRNTHTTTETVFLEPTFSRFLWTENPNKCSWLSNLWRCLPIMRLRINQSIPGKVVFTWLSCWSYKVSYMHDQINLQKFQRNDIHCFTLQSILAIYALKEQEDDPRFTTKEHDGFLLQKKKNIWVKVQWGSQLLWAQFQYLALCTTPNYALDGEQRQSALIRWLFYSLAPIESTILSINFKSVHI